MTNRYQMRWLGLVVASVLTVAAEAALLGRLPATPGGTDYQAAYDDVLDITWVTNADLNGIGRWPDMVAWAEGLELGGADDWRLASMSVSAGVPTGRTDSVVDCETATELACRDNELGYMYYYNLPPGSGPLGRDKRGTQTVGDVTLTDIQTFYWSGTEVDRDDVEGVWTFLFSNATISQVDKVSLNYGWAVHDGDIGLIPPPPTAVVAASLPSSRSVQVGSLASAFATVINTGNATATDCSIAPPTSVAADFAYQTTDAANAPTGTPNTPADIAAGGSQNFIFGFLPSAPISPTEVVLTYDCTNSDPAPSTAGLNTLLLSASSSPVPDMVALAATPSGDGIVNLPGPNGANAFAVSTVNVGSDGSITAEPGTSDDSLPLVLSICETNPTTGLCVTAVGSSTTSTVTGNATPTYSVFATATGEVPFDPAANRIVVEFKDGGNAVRGSTSVAVRTQ